MASSRIFASGPIAALSAATRARSRDAEPTPTFSLNASNPRDRAARASLATTSGGTAASKHCTRTCVGRDSRATRATRQSRRQGLAVAARGEVVEGALECAARAGRVRAHDPRDGLEPARVDLRAGLLDVAGRRRRALEEGLDPRDQRCASGDGGLGPEPLERCRLAEPHVARFILERHEMSVTRADLPMRRSQRLTQR